MDKVGVKPGLRVCVVGVRDEAVLRQVRERATHVLEGRVAKESDLVLAGIASKADLAKLARLRAALRPAGALWAIWVKGEKALSENDVRAAALRAGLVDIKVVRVSATLSGLKLVVPVARNEELRMQKKIGFAGLGLMGSRMARQLLEKGFPLTVWNRTAERCQALADRGAGVARTPYELAAASDVVIACVADPPAVERLVFADDGVLAAARPGFRYLECSTISPDLMRRVGEALRSKGADALEAPVTGSKVGAEKGTLLLMTGGRREVHEELMPVMMAMGSKAVHCGELGQASVAKLIGNTFISFMLEALCEGIVVGGKAGLSIETILEIVMASGFASPYYTFKGSAIARRDFEQHFSIDLLVKDQNLMLAEASASRTPMPGLAAIREVFQAARAQGSGQEDIAAVVKALERAAGLGASH